MKFITDQVNMAIQNINLEKPIIKLERSYYGSIRMILNNKPSFDGVRGMVDDVVMEQVTYRTRVKLNIEKKKYIVSVDIAEVIELVLCRVIDAAMHFLVNHGGFANNRLSKTYKWFKQKVNYRSMHVDEKLAQDMYNVVKFAKKAVSADDAEAIKTARSLFLLIKDRYEPTLGSIKV